MVEWIDILVKIILGKCQLSILEVNIYSELTLSSLTVDLNIPEYVTGSVRIMEVTRKQALARPYG